MQTMGARDRDTIDMLKEHVQDKQTIADTLTAPKADS